MQDHKYAARIVKNIDALLKIGGELKLVLLNTKSHSKSVRSISQVKHFLSLLTNGRYIHDSCITSGLITILHYTKNGPTLINNDSIDSWSFGIISNGKKNDWVIEQIKSISNQGIKNYEILICGPSPFEKVACEKDKIKIISDVTLDDGDIRAPVCHKKNLIIEGAKYNNLCICHDRFLLPKNWFSSMNKYGNYFDILCLKVTNDKGNRILVDWMKFKSPLMSTYKRNNPLMYNEWDSDAIAPGGAFLVKKNLIEKFKFDERLYWDEMEDIYFSKVSSLNGLLIDIDSNNHFITREVRQFSQNDSWISLKFLGFFYWIKSLVLILLKYHKSKKYYYENYKNF